MTNKYVCLCGGTKFEIMADRIVCECGQAYRVAAVSSPERFNKIKNQYQIMPEIPGEKK